MECSGGGKAGPHMEGALPHLPGPSPFPRPQVTLSTSVPLALTDIPPTPPHYNSSGTRDASVSWSVRLSAQHR